MKHINLKINGQDVTVANAIKKIKSYYEYNNEEIGEACGLSNATISNLILEKDFVNNTSTRKIIDYIRRHEYIFTPKALEKFKLRNSTLPENFYNKLSIIKNNEDMVPLHGKTNSGKATEDSILECAMIVKSMKEKNHMTNADVCVALKIKPTTLGRINALNHNYVSQYTLDVVKKNYELFTSREAVVESTPENTKTFVKRGRTQSGKSTEEEILYASLIIDELKSKKIKPMKIVDILGISQTTMSRVTRLLNNYVSKDTIQLIISNYDKYLKQKETFIEGDVLTPKDTTLRDNFVKSIPKIEEPKDEIKILGMSMDEWKKIEEENRKLRLQEIEDEQSIGRVERTGPVPDYKFIGEISNGNAKTNFIDQSNIYGSAPLKIEEDILSPLEKIIFPTLKPGHIGARPIDSLISTTQHFLKVLEAYKDLDIEAILQENIDLKEKLSGIQKMLK